MSTRGLSQAPGDQIYEVERILKKRHHPSRGVLYFVKWRNYPNSANTWEPACNFSQKLIEIHEAKHGKGRKSIASNRSNPGKSSNPHNRSERSQEPPRKNSSLRRQQQVQLQLDIQAKQKTQMPIERQQLAVFNPVGNHYLPTVKEVVYEPELTKEPIIVTDVTTRHLTVTISECMEPEGFFSK